MVILPPPPLKDDAFDFLIDMMESDNKVIRFLGFLLTVVIFILMIGIMAWLVWIFYDLGGIPEFLNTLKEILNMLKEDLPW